MDYERFLRFQASMEILTQSLFCSPVALINQKKIISGRKVVKRSDFAEKGDNDGAISLNERWT